MVKVYCPFTRLSSHLYEHWQSGLLEVIQLLLQPHHHPVVLAALDHLGVLLDALTKLRVCNVSVWQV